MVGPKKPSGSGISLSRPGHDVILRLPPPKAGDSRPRDQSFSSNFNDPMTQSSNLHRFAILTAACTLLLLLAGALVTSNDAGDSVPDWPLSYGTLFPPLVGNILFEQSHRYVAGLVGLLTLALALWIWRADDRSWLRRLGWLAFAGVVAQALLGGLRVLNPQLSKPIALVHACIAQLFFCTLVALCVFTSRWWQSDYPQLDDRATPHLRSIAVATFAVTFLQLLLGATFRHFKGSFNPHVVIVPHVLNAFVVLAMTLILARAIRARLAATAAVRKSSLILTSLVSIQILLGAAAYVTVIVNRDALQPLPVMVWATVLHLVIGAVVLAATVVLGLATFRLVKPAPRREVESVRERAAA